jgi:hypothetical protein
VVSIPTLIVFQGLRTRRRIMGAREKWTASGNSVTVSETIRRSVRAKLNTSLDSRRRISPATHVLTRVIGAAG